MCERDEKEIDMRENRKEKEIVKEMREREREMREK